MVENFARYTGIYSSQFQANIVPFDLFWFLQYGTPIMLATVIDIFISPIAILLISWLGNHIQKLAIPRQKFHKGLLRMLRPYPFAIEDILPYLISFILTSLALLPGMPLMMPCLFALFLSQFWLQKYLLVKNNSVPKKYHQKSIRSLIKGVPFALMIPLIAGLVVYTNLYNSHVEDYETCGDDGYCDHLEFLVSFLNIYNKLQKED